MNSWLLGSIVILAGGMPAALWIGARGSPVDRLVGLEFAGVVATLFMLGFSQAVHEPSYLIVPLVLVLVSFAGTLVFTRLLAPRS